MSKYYKMILAALVCVALGVGGFVSARGETFRAKVVLADKPDEPVAGATVKWYAIGKKYYDEGDVQTNAKGEFRVVQRTTYLLVLVFNKEGTHSVAAVLTPDEEATLKLTPGKSVTCTFMLGATEKDKEPTPIAGQSFSLCLSITDKDGKVELYWLPDFFQKKRTDADGKVTFANLPEKPESEIIPKYGYYLTINRELMVNEVKQEEMYSIGWIDFGDVSPQFVISSWQLQIRDFELVDFVFNPVTQSPAGFLQSLVSTVIPPKKKQLLLVFNPGETQDSLYENEAKVQKLISLLFYDPDIAPVFQKYHVRGVRTMSTTWERDADGGISMKAVENKLVADYLKKLDKSLENLGVLTFCVLDEKGKYLLSLPYESVVGTTLNARGEEIETVLPGLLLAFLEAFVE